MKDCLTFKGRELYSCMYKKTLMIRNDCPPFYSAQ